MADKKTYTKKKVANILEEAQNAEERIERFKRMNERMEAKGQCGIYHPERTNDNEYFVISPKGNIQTNRHEAELKIYEAIDKHNEQEVERTKGQVSEKKTKNGKPRKARANLIQEKSAVLVSFCFQLPCQYVSQEYCDILNNTDKYKELGIHKTFLYNPSEKEQTEFFTEIGKGIMEYFKLNDNANTMTSIHKDEATPHCHLHFTPTDKDGYFNLKKLFYPYGKDFEKNKKFMEDFYTKTDERLKKNIKWYQGGIVAEKAEQRGLTHKDDFTLIRNELKKSRLELKTKEKIYAELENETKGFISKKPTERAEYIKEKNKDIHQTSEVIARNSYRLQKKAEEAYDVKRTEERIDGKIEELKKREINLDNDTREAVRKLFEKEQARVDKLKAEAKEAEQKAKDEKSTFSTYLNENSYQKSILESTKQSVKKEQEKLAEYRENGKAIIDRELAEYKAKAKAQYDKDYPTFAGLVWQVNNLQKALNRVLNFVKNLGSWDKLQNHAERNNDNGGLLCGSMYEIEEKEKEKEQEMSYSEPSI